VAESVFATLECEVIRKHGWHARDETLRSIFRHLETWYNRKRPHSTLGSISPVVYEAQLQVAA
jgi:putative transposase